MGFYELVFIARQEVSSVDVDGIVDGFSKSIEESSGCVTKTEYWGLRSLAYAISGNTKGHYVFMGIEGSPSLLKTLERKLKFAQDILRHSIIRVDSISADPSPILKNKQSDLGDVIDVTVGNDKI
jgi:small subunit ribosomal protein S6